MTSVFFYGLFMDADLLREKGLKPRNVELVTVHGYGLRIGKRASLELSADEHCYGTVMQLEESELAALYSGDGVEDYRPETVTATKSSGESVEVVSYLLTAELMIGSNSDYATALAGVARKLGLATEYILEIESWI